MVCFATDDTSRAVYRYAQYLLLFRVMQIYKYLPWGVCSPEANFINL